MNTLKNNYKKSWKYLGENKNYIILIISIFVLASLIAVIFPAPDFIEQAIIEQLRQIEIRFSDKGILETSTLIFGNNFLISALSLLGGFLLGILPVWYAFSNGYVIGYVMKLVVAEAGITILWRLLPHGIFELPAIFISMGLGLRIGVSLFTGKIKYNFIESVRTFTFIVGPLLLVAAIIEGILVALLA